MTGTGKMVTFSLQANEVVRGRELHGRVDDMDERKGWPSDWGNGWQRWVGGGYRPRCMRIEFGPLDLRRPDRTVIGR